MPNWVVNKITVDGPNAEDIIRSHFIKEENGEDAFDFNTITRMPEKLKIEKSSKSSDGFKLYIAKINPIIPNLGTHEEKMLPIGNFFNKMVSLFGTDCIDNIQRYILKPSEIEQLKDKYKEEFNDVVNLGEKVFHNYEQYGVPDWYDWSILNWGSKWNACNTILSEDGKTLYFDTAWTPTIPVIAKFAEMHPELKVTHEYAEEQTGFLSGRFEYEDGEMVVHDEFEPYSKEAYEMSFELWGCEEDYKFNKETGTYDYIDPDEEPEM